MYRQSEDMRTGVLNALYWDLRVPRHQVRVEIENGWVTVSGTVDLPYQKTCAEFDVQKRPGSGRRHQPDPAPDAQRSQHAAAESRH